jgi:hypothetical protein
MASRTKVFEATWDLGVLFKWLDMKDLELNSFQICLLRLY